MFGDICVESNDTSIDNLTCLYTAWKEPSFFKMAAEASGLAQLDVFLAGIFAEWNVYSTAIATTITLFLVYNLFSSREPDVHPFLLARQATEAPVRQPGRSAAFRSLEVPHGFPLRSGLNVKDPDAPRWTGGRNGDLRDVWRSAARGTTGENAGQRGNIHSVLGKKTIDHPLDEVTAEINVIGRHIQESGVKTVAVSLSDSVELLALIFGKFVLACFGGGYVLTRL